MTDNPRKRLARLMDGLDLPKGFRLTPAREACLLRIGSHILEHGDLTCTGNYLKISRLNLGYTMRYAMTSREKAAFRVMGKSGWIKLQDRPGQTGYWQDRDVIFQEGLKQLAMRLGARSTLWKERKRMVMEAAEKPYEQLREALWAARRTISNITSDPMVGENDVLEAYRKVRTLTSSLQDAEQELERVKKAVGEIQEPSEDDAMAWLMARRLSGPKND